MGRPCVLRPTVDGPDKGYLPCWTQLSRLGGGLGRLQRKGEEGAAKLAQMRDGASQYMFGVDYGYSTDVTPAFAQTNLGRVHAANWDKLPGEVVNPMTEQMAADQWQRRHTVRKKAVDKEVQARANQ